MQPVVRPGRDCLTTCFIAEHAKRSANCTFVASPLWQFTLDTANPLPQELSAAAKKKAKRKAKEKAAKAGAGAEAAAAEKLAAEKPGKGKKMSAAVRAMQEAQEARQRAEEAARLAEEERKRQVGPENRYR